MTKIRLHNSRTRKRDEFTPLDPENVRMYVCGPTVYDRAHLGNARPVVVFDVLYRLLRHVYGEGHVTYVRNFTDVDDKINARAARMQADGDGRPLNAIVQALTDETIGWYHADMDALGARRPDHEPRATQFITQMIAMIDGLIAKGHAYEVSGHVLFDVRSYPDYGRLSGRSVDDMIAGARVEVAPYKRDPMDFVLWKPSDAGLPGWDSPWGRGRPGWHIECSAMSHELLGASFDIHGGGIDLQFPHHENEIAQSCCAFPDAGFARYWLHNEMVQVEGKKMSKSLGNFFTVRDLLDQGWPGEVIRFVMLSTHYRKPTDWTEEKAREAARMLRWWRTMTARQKIGKVSEEAIKALSDDLNTPQTLKELKRMASVGAWSELKASARAVGLLTPQLSDWDWEDRSIIRAKNYWRKNIKKVEKAKATDVLSAKDLDELQKAIERVSTVAQSVAAFTQTKAFEETVTNLQKFQKAMEKVDFSSFQAAAAAANKWQNLVTANPKILETVDDEVQVSFSVFEAAVNADIPALIDEQSIARASQDYVRADEIRAKAREAGFEIVNRKEGAKWRPIP